MIDSLLRRLIDAILKSPEFEAFVAKLVWKALSAKRNVIED